MIGRIFADTAGIVIQKMPADGYDALILVRTAHLGRGGGGRKARGFCASAQSLRPRACGLCCHVAARGRDRRSRPVLGLLGFYRLAKSSSAANWPAVIASLPLWPVCSMTASSAAGQAHARSQAMSRPLMSMRPWISTAGMPARR